METTLEFSRKVRKFEKDALLWSVHAIGKENRTWSFEAERPGAELSQHSRTRERDWKYGEREETYSKT